MGLADILSNIFPTAYAEEEQVVEVVEEVIEEEEPEEAEDPKPAIMEGKLYGKRKPDTSAMCSCPVNRVRKALRFFEATP